VGVRLFDSLAILPEHRLAEAYREGRLAEAWGLGTPPEEVVGLGPFRVRRHLPGERLELERNPHYWKVDREGRRLPYLDELVFLFVPDENAELLLFQNGQTHLIDDLSAEDFTRLQGEAERRGLRLEDLGPGLSYHFLFWNLNDLAGRELPEIARKQRWFGEVAFRRAVSRAIDREAMVRLVYRGRATPIATHVSPGNRLWRNTSIPPPERSLPEARRLLREAGFTWDDDGRLRDPGGAPVEFTVATNASSAERVRMATLLQEDLDQLGIRVGTAALEFRALIGRIFNSYDYEACLLGLGGGDVDPNSAMNVWLSDGSHHFWRLGQSEPATEWEAEIDELLRRQLVTLDPVERKRLYDRVQEVVAERVPMIFLVSPNVLVGARREVGNFRPAILDHPTLWNVEELYIRRGAAPSAER
jgi:peptide/nickel transport system substrate-binding protein